MNTISFDLDPSQPDGAWEAALHEVASGFPYPPTPDLTRAVRARLAVPPARRVPPMRLSHALLIALLITVLILSALVAVPQTRAALLRFLRIGGITILLEEPTPTPAPTATPALESAASPAPTQRPTRTPWPTPTVMVSASGLAGETTLAEARARADFPIRLPSYPPDLGLPDRVYLQDLGGQIVILVWLQPGSDTEAVLSLHILAPGVEATKGPPEEIQVTKVNGQRAVWTTGPYILIYEDGGRTNADFRRLVDGHVLIWEAGTLTYRLETGLTLNEAVKIAESLE